MKNHNPLKQHWYLVLCFFCLLTGNITKAAQVSGIITIDPNGIPSTYVFKSLGSAVTYLTSSGGRQDGGPVNSAPFGVNGPLLISVTAGTYTEQINFPLITGVSESNPITIRSNTGNAADVIFSFSGTSTSAHTLRLNAAKFINLEALTITGTGVAAWPVHIYNNSSNILVKNCVISTTYTLAQQITTAHIGIAVNNSTSTASLSSSLSSDILIENNMLLNAYAGIVVSMSNATVNRDNIIIRKNKIDSAAFFGVMLQAVKGFQISNNTINMRISNGASINSNGINLLSCGATVNNIVISGNVIRKFNRFGIYCDNSGGLDIARGRIINNSIDGNYNQSNSAGICFNAAPNCKNWDVWNNSILINTTANSTPSCFRMEFAGFNNTDVRNNIFTISSSGSAHNFFSIGGRNMYKNINSNNFYKLSPAVNLIKLDANIYNADYNMPYSGGTASISQNPLFASQDTLIPATGSYNGEYINEVLVDISGKYRSSLPDMGCYELPSSLYNDLSIVEVKSPGYRATVGQNRVKVTMINLGSSMVTQFRIGHSVNSLNVKDTLITGVNLLKYDTLTVDMGLSKQAVFAEGNNLLSVFTSLPNGVLDDDKTNDTVTTLRIGSLSGVYTINPSGTGPANFTTFAGALTALKELGVGGPVIFNVAAARYNEQVAIKRIEGVSRFNTITFNGVDSSNTIITDSGLTAPYVVSIDSSNHITLNNLKIIATNTTSGKAAISIYGASFPADSITINRCNLVIAYQQANTFGIEIRSPQHQSISVNNCSISGGYYGIANQQASITKCFNNVYTGNTIRSILCISLLNHDRPVIRNNKFIQQNATSNPVINLQGNIRIDLSGNTIIGQNGFGVGIYGTIADSSESNFIYNNMILCGKMDNRAYTGIIINSAYCNVFNNSLRVITNTSGCAIQIGLSNLKLINNNLVVIPDTTVIKQLPPIIRGSATLIKECDYNNYYGSLAFNTSSFSAFKGSLYSGSDLHSLNIDPHFISETDLHTPSTDELDSAGIMLGAVNTDFDGESRKAIPDIGADEFDMPSINTGVGAIIKPAISVPMGRNEVHVVIKNFGLQTITSDSVYCLVDSIIFRTKWTGSLVTGATDTVRFTATSGPGNSDQRHYFGINSNTIKAWTRFPNLLTDSFTFDDTTTAIVCVGITGTYTLNPAGTGLNNFTSFEHAIGKLSCGISGPVVINVAANSGPYTGPFAFPFIKGTSEINTITFNGNGNTITSAATPITLSGVSYITIDSFTLSTTTSSAPVVQVVSKAHHIRLNRNNIVGSSTNNVASVSIIDNAAAPINGSDTRYIDITNNLFSGGGIVVRGVNARNYSFNILNNTFAGITGYGINIELLNIDSVNIHNNYFSAGRPSGNSTLIGIMATYVQQLKINGNRMHSVSNVGSFIGIRIASCYGSTSRKNEIINNTFSDITAASTVNAMILTSSERINIFNNSIYLKAKAPGNILTGLNLTQTSEVDFRNNIFKVSGTSNGNRIGIQLNASTFFTSNNNVFDIEPGHTSYIGSLNGLYTTLAEWTAATALDSLSFSTDPDFTDTASGNLIPRSVIIDNKGVQIGVPSDITGAVRSAQPDIGAYEFNSQLCFGKPDAGNAVSNETYACSNSKLTLALKNDQVLYGLKYQWQYSNTGGNGPFTNLVNDTIREISRTQTGTTWYRSIVTCPYSGQADTSGSARVRTKHTTLSAGVYTVNPSVLDTGNNYYSLRDVANEMKCVGISGPVTINVFPGSGPHEGFTLDSIPGSSAANSIVINGNGTTVIRDFTPIIWFSNSAYVTLDSFDITGAPGFAGMGILLSNESHHINITRNTINVGHITNTYPSAAIASSTTYKAFNNGNNAHHVIVKGNRINSGGYGTMFRGPASGYYNLSITIADNKVMNAGSVYCSGGDSVAVNNNDIDVSRSNLTAVINMPLVTNAKVNRNVIYNSIPVSRLYGISMQNNNSVAMNVEISNNVISGTEVGDFIGMMMYGYPRSQNIYHNTIQHIGNGEQVWKTTGILLQADGTNVNFKNNIVSFTGRARKGVKTAIYLGGTGTLITSNNNLVYMNTPDSNYFGYRNSADVKTIANWRTATSQDALTKTVDPLFADLQLRNFKPLATAVDNMGASVGITNDITGAQRSLTTPDVGAYEFAGDSDLAITGARLVRSSDCYSTHDSVQVTVINVSAYPVNFAQVPLTVNWAVSGPVNSNGSIVVNTGTLSAGGTGTFFSANVNRSLIGVYVLTAQLLPNAANKGKTNDMLDVPVSSEVYPYLSVFPKVTTLQGIGDSLMLNAKSPLFSSQIFFSEICHYKDAGIGAPLGGWPYYMRDGDYVEITGFPNGSLEGYTMEEWRGNVLFSSVTFTKEHVFGPNGTMLVSTGQIIGDPSPLNYYYRIGYPSIDHQSADSQGYVIRSPFGKITDAVTYGGAYVFPAAAGVTVADWSGVSPKAGTTCGNKLNGLDNNTAANWVNSAIDPQTPNVINSNAGVSPVGFKWMNSGNTIGTINNKWVGPYTTTGIYTYVASYTHACGTSYDTALVGVGVPVPVTIQSFNARLNGIDAILEWKTATEKNVRVFEIYSSADNEEFELIGAVNAKGNTATVMSYSYTEPDAMRFINKKYYKLKTIDFDNNASWSNVVTVSVNEPLSASQPLAYPNPFNKELKIYVPQVSTLARVSIVNILGEVLFSREFMPDADNIVKLDDMENIKEGIYFIHVTDGTNTYMQKVIKTNEE